MKRVLVTGAARRIGAALAWGLAEDGWHIVAHYNRSGDDAERLRVAMEEAGKSCVTIQADLSDRDAVRGLIGTCITRFGPLDALVNNASSFRYDDLRGMDARSWDAHLVPNLEAPLFLARDFARALDDRTGGDKTGGNKAGGDKTGGNETGGNKTGDIVNMLDHKVVAPNPDFFSYSVAKLAMAGATRLLAQALRGHVRVNGIAPGITMLSGKQTQAGFARAWHAPPLGRSSTPAELAGACRYILATPSLNGQILVLDGGESLLGRQRDIAFETE